MRGQNQAYAVSVVMPAMNEERNILQAVADVVDGFQRTGVSGEIVIVNDGSSDRTGELAEGFKAQYPFISVVHHERNLGIGASFWDGVQHSRGEFVTMIPGDGENCASEILRYLPLMDQVDIVVPFVYNRDVRSFRRRILSITYREIIKASFGLSLNYMNGTVLYRKAILDGISLRAAGFFYQTELLVKTILNGYLYAEVPYALLRRGGGDSKATTLKSLGKVARAYLGLMGEIYLGGWKRGPIVPDSATARRGKDIEAAP